MARWLMLGCLGFLIFLGLGGWAAYVWLIRPAQSLVNDFRQVINLDKGVEKQSSYRPPANALLTPSQVNRFVRVQREVRGQLGERYKKIEARLNQLSQQQQGQGTLDYRAALDLFRDSGGLIVEAKKIQVKAVNQQDFSAEEYRWVKAQVYSALGLGIPNLNPSEVLRQIGNRDFDPKVDLQKTPAPQANVKLVEPHRKELEAYYPFTWFGL